MKVYTKTGDKGQTSLVGGQRVSKSNIRIEAYGTIDELNSFIGMLRNYKIDSHDLDLLSFIQNKLFDIGSVLAFIEKDAKYKVELKQIEDIDIKRLEQSIDTYSKELPIQKNFIIPAGSEIISWCNICRTICRRAERRIIEINDTDFSNSNLNIFINRLSDLLFVMGRKYANNNNVEEIIWRNDL